MHCYTNQLNLVRELQADLDKLIEWETAWSMEFHPEKCKLLRITNKRKVTAGSYQIHGHDLEQMKKTKYLTLAKTCCHFLQRNISLQLTKRQSFSVIKYLSDQS